ncbi:hypothetical protein NHX12_026137 [Muraenolepis orangiensis]|uniref:Kinesin-like protein n=1 Tax=Muraenolepis orangiensis TaxID=630683 RepID=A0A9Q0EJ29_9TELE|nr:hypothetical protein NHX12_026137 [Muraenolepis orangiensis]
MSKNKSGESVKVVVRCRPLSRKEEASVSAGGIVAMDLRLGQVVLRNPRAPPSEPQKTFTFDAVYDGDSKQRDLYDESVRPLIDSVLAGFNGTIFAYGQTGTGKTHTMQGAWMDPDQRGVIPNAFDHIFTHISRSQSDRQYLVRASYLEIYLEEVRDLLDPGRALELRESPETGVYVRDLTSCVCKSVKEIEEVMNSGNRARAVAATDMNEHSSRSHTLFLITVECSQPGPDGREHIRVGRLNLVDLAGSERQAKTGVRGERLKEAAKINLSLSALGNVISALADGRSGHVPYRDSKLTRLLQDSLGGNARTVMVATLGPAPQHYDETLTTLRYANRAKNIQNRPRQKLLGEKERMMGDLRKEQEAAELLTAKYKAMESKLLVGGRNITDHTNEQQKMLEMKRQEIAEQSSREREIQQQLYAKLQCIKAEIQDNELTRELKFKLTFDSEEDQWRFQPLVPVESKLSTMKKRPASAVGYKRPISQYARVAIAMGAHSRYRAENIMFLELDVTPPTVVSLARSPEAELHYTASAGNSPTKEKASRVRKSRSWCQTPKSISSSSSTVSLATYNTATPTAAQ